MQTAASRLDGLGWSPELAKPDFQANYVTYGTAQPETRQSLAELGIRVMDETGNNFILLEKGFKKLGGAVQIHFRGPDNVFAISANTALSGAFNCAAGTVAVIGGQQHALKLSVMLYRGGKLFWGHGASTFGCRLWVDGGKSVVVGDGCLFSEAIEIRTSDHHSVIDLDNYTQVNHPADVTIGRHVWVGPRVSIQKGVTIGRGSIIAAGALVSRSVPPRELWGGVPARLIKRRVSWVGSHPAKPEAVEHLRQMIESGEW